VNLEKTDQNARFFTRNRHSRPGQKPAKFWQRRRTGQIEHVTQDNVGNKTIKRMAS
jgi:hypothetical protein